MAKKENTNSRIIRITLQKAVAFNPILGKVSGSAIAGLFLSQLLYWHEKGSDKDWTYKTIAEFQNETTLNRSEQDRAIKIWKSLGVIEVKLKGIPPKRHFRINLERLVDLIKDIANREVPMPDIANQFAENNKSTSENEQNITEITFPETTFTDRSLQEPKNRWFFENKNFGNIL